MLGWRQSKIILVRKAFTCIIFMAVVLHVQDFKYSQATAVQ